MFTKVQVSFMAGCLWGAIVGIVFRLIVGTC